MADYDFEYQLNSAPEARLDGSGQVGHDITAVFREEGTADPFVPVPGHHKTILLPQDGLATVMAMPDATAPQKQAKNTAYKDLLVDNRDTPAVPYTSGWTKEGLEVFTDANDASAAQATAADDYITVTLGQSYPVQFSLNG